VPTGGEEDRGRTLVALDVGARCAGWLGDAVVAAHWLPLVQQCWQRGGPVDVRAAHALLLSGYRARLPAVLDHTGAFVPRLLAVRWGPPRRSLQPWLM
jgi:hypothetical protein